jgi:hypothetical protein
MDDNAMKEFVLKYCAPTLFSVSVGEDIFASRVSLMDIPSGLVTVDFGAILIMQSTEIRITRDFIELLNTSIYLKNVPLVIVIFGLELDLHWDGVLHGRRQLLHA